MIGLIAGALVVLGVSLLNRFRIDDVVGAWPAHGLCGLWGGIATGIFGDYDLGVQVLGFGLVGEIIIFSQARNLKEYRIESVFEAEQPHEAPQPESKD